MSTKALCKYLMHFTVLNYSNKNYNKCFSFFLPLSLSLLKFNRCITSQLIKWFSNFREFYYIQMEKFARQAINDGVTGVRKRWAWAGTCELFRALNMHYNKANDFEVSLRPLPLFHTTAFTLSGHTVLRGEIHSDALRYYFDPFP